MKYIKKPFKKSMIIVLTMALLLTATLISSAETQDFTITGQPVSTNIGETFSVKFTFANNPGISIFSLNINYDSNILELLELNGNPLMGGSFKGNVPEKFAFWMNYTGDSSFNGVAFTAVFKVKNNVLADNTQVYLSLPYNSGNILNDNGDDIIPIISPVDISISHEALKGDVNGDGNIDVCDCVCIALYVDDKKDLTAAQLIAADVDGVDGVTIDDAQKIAKYVARLIPNL